MDPERLRRIVTNLERQHKEMGKTLEVLREAVGEPEPDPFWQQDFRKTADEELECLE